jgi:hypothetical protein
MSTASKLALLFSAGAIAAAIAVVPIDDDETTDRVKDYAVTLYKTGATPVQIYNRLVERGVSEDRAERLARRIKGRGERIVRSLHTERVGLATATARAAQNEDLITAALCEPLQRENDTPAYNQCLSRQEGYLGERWCVDDVEVARGARARLTEPEYDRVLAVIQSTPTIRGVNNATDERYAGMIRSVFPGAERCVDPES